MKIPSRAVVSMEARREAGEYPFTLEALDTREWWLRMPEVVQSMDPALARRYIKDTIDEEERDRKFIAQVASLYKESGFERVGFMYLATDAPDAVACHVASDDSFAIGVDHKMVLLFSYVFSPLFIAHVYDRENFTWVIHLHDLVVKIFAGQEHPGIDRRILEMGGDGPPTVKAFVDKARVVAEHFIIAHELGHIFHDHHKRRSALRLELAERGAGQDELASFDLVAEHEADQWAAQLLVKIANNNLMDKALARYVPPIYFGFFALARRLYIPRDVFGKALVDSHPDPWARVERLKGLIERDEEGMSDAVTDAKLLAGLFKRIEQEWNNPAFEDGAAAVRAILAKAPPSPEELSKRVPLAERKRTFVGAYEKTAFARQVLLKINAVYYFATAGIVWFHFQEPNDTLLHWLLLLVSAIGFLLAIACFPVAKAFDGQRWRISAYGQSFGLAQHTGLYLAQTAFLLKLSGYPFGLSASIVALLFMFS